MRAVVQRVKSAKVEIDGATVGEIGSGLLVYLGVGKGDVDADRAWLLDKITGLRIFSNELGKMDKSVIDIAGSLLVVSQFTLYADIKRGRRPSFDEAMPPQEANAMYEAFVRDARGVLRVETGRFGADMAVSSVNDGPVTLSLDSKKT
jgi:D-aminoacyl-tRNA deacylase